MASAADAGAERRQSAHEVAVEALSTYPCRSGDTFDLWQFDDTSSRVGEITVSEASSSALRDLAAQLDEPSGGTEIGGALENVLAHSKAPDILLITDGQSYALDVHSLASRGRRISVILVGEGSLDAKVGHLAALTGGCLGRGWCGHWFGDAVRHRQPSGSGDASGTDIRAWPKRGHDPRPLRTADRGDFGWNRRGC
jgi:hypothetical protein